MTYIEHARKLRPIIERAAQSLDDKAASKAPEIFGGMKYDGSLIAAGTRINWNGTLMLAAVDLWDYAEYNPDNAPALWQNIAYRDGIRIIPVTIAVTEAFAKGELGWWGDEIHESLLDENVFTPAQYAAGWKKI